VTLNDSGQASFAPDYYLNVGDSVAASYDGDSTYGSSNRTIIPNIQPAQTATSLTATPNPADPTDDVTFTATVTNRSTGIPPFGSVQFVIDGVQLDPIALDDNGQAGIIVSGFDPGDYTVQAAYHDDTGPIPDFTDSQSSLNEHINSPPSPQPAPPTPPPLAATPAPNNNFTPLMAAVANDGTITLVESAPDPGVFTASAMTRSGYIASAITRGTNCKRTKHGRRCVVKKPGPALYGTGSATATTPGMVRLTIKPNAKAKWALTHGTTLRVSVSVTFQSARGGVPKTAVTTVTAKGTRSARKHPTRRHT
jgi:hypothetical protein